MEEVLSVMTTDRDLKVIESVCIVSPCLGGVQPHLSQTLGTFLICALANNP